MSSLKSSSYDMSLWQEMTEEWMKPEKSYKLVEVTVKVLKVSTTFFSTFACTLLLILRVSYHVCKGSRVS